MTLEQAFNFMTISGLVFLGVMFSVFAFVGLCFFISFIVGYARHGLKPLIASKKKTENPKEQSTIRNETGIELKMTNGKSYWISGN